MSRLPSAMQAEAFRARKRHDSLVKLLNAFDWSANGYKDKFEWLRDVYGPGRDLDLIFKCQEQFEREDLL